MALRKIIENDMEFLGKKSRPVVKFDEKLATLLDDMKETLQKMQGAGLAAPQVGILRRIFIADVESEDGSYMEFINPEIISAKGKSDKYYEGCLSFPGRAFKITRAETVTVRAQDRNGKEFTFTADDFVARCLQHETDHLNGVTIPMIGEEVFDYE